MLAGRVWVFTRWTLLRLKDFEVFSLFGDNPGYVGVKLFACLSQMDQRVIHDLFPPFGTVVVAVDIGSVGDHNAVGMCVGV